MTTSSTTPEQLFGYDVLDANGNKIGTVDGVWVDDATSRLEFVGVKTGWIFGKTHLIPTESAQIDDSNQTVQAPFSEDQIKDAPSFGVDDELSPSDEEDIYGYYGLQRSASGSPTGMAADTTSTADTSPAAATDTAPAAATTLGTAAATSTTTTEPAATTAPGTDVDASGQTRLRRIGSPTSTDQAPAADQGAVGDVTSPSTADNPEVTP